MQRRNRVPGMTPLRPHLFQITVTMTRLEQQFFSFDMGTQEFKHTFRGIWDHKDLGPPVQRKERSRTSTSTFDEGCPRGCSATPPVQVLETWDSRCGSRAGWLSRTDPQLIVRTRTYARESRCDYMMDWEHAWDSFYEQGAQEKDLV